jgi:hypothetical protein
LSARAAQTARRIVGYSGGWSARGLGGRIAFAPADAIVHGTHDPVVSFDSLAEAEGVEGGGAGRDGQLLCRAASTRGLRRGQFLRDVFSAKDRNPEPFSGRL